VSVIVIDVHESGELRHIETRLIERFSPPLRREEVERCFLEAVAAYQDAPVRTYLGVLVERLAVDRLRTAISVGGC
jgi:hypothetical protein